MRLHVAVKGLLILAGLLAVVIGGSIVVNPVAFHASSGISLPAETNLLSEIRAPGGALFAAGCIIMLGAFVRRLTFTAILVSAMIYLSYGVSRVFSLYVDGIPGTSLILATVIELVIGLLCLIYLSMSRGYD